MFGSYYEVRDWLEGFIPFTYSKENLGLARIRYLLKLLGNPQKKFKSIHIAGTSGKGSTAFYIGRLLQVIKLQTPNSKFQKKIISKKNWKLEIRERIFGKSKSGNWKFQPKVGLHLSPHLVDLRERMQILFTSVIPANAGIHKPVDDWILDRVGDDSTLIPIGRFLRLFNQIRPIVEGIKKIQPDLTPSYFEILVAASFLYFAQEKVDWAVVEVGLGGRLDATNVLRPELCVITNVGLDHTDILGRSIEEIAYEKAGIIKSNTKHGTRNRKQETGDLVITGATGKALEVIKKVAKEKKAQLITINTQSPKITSKTDSFGNITEYIDLFNHNPQKFAFENGLLAVFALSALRIKLSLHTIKEAFSVGFPGRLEEIDKGVILDGAHNPQKIKFLVNFLRKFTVHPSTSLRADSSPFDFAQGRQFTVILVVAFKKGKEWQKMLDLLINNLPIKAVIATKFNAVTDMGRYQAVGPQEITNYIELKSKRVKVEGFDNSQEAVFEALAQAGFTPGVSNDQSGRTPGVSPALVLITGSLYLVGEVRTIWHLPDF
ncbi:hypothetical protein A2470_01805 [Candidatus Curtissbacteria bacterium RIFOXYC2_FULL_41_11]|nr:MAG: hypothetical protein A2470_01805 [Candidatus Curtissbacteria bacterium RIFOXYC2_FULL_41_11]